VHFNLLDCSIMEHVGLMGRDLDSMLISQENPYTTSTFASIHGAWTEVSPEAIWGDARTKFPHPEIVMMLFYTLTLPSCRPISPLGIINVLLLLGFETFVKVSDRPLLTLNSQCRHLRASVIILTSMSTPISLIVS